MHGSRHFSGWGGGGGEKYLSLLGGGAEAYFRSFICKFQKLNFPGRVQTLNPPSPPPLCRSTHDMCSVLCSKYKRDKLHQ